MSSISINRKTLNLVLTLDTSEGVGYVHSSVISEAIFEQHFLLIGKTYSSLLEQGGAYMMTMGPRSAYLMLKKVAGDEWPGVQRTLMAEIHRLTNYLRPTSSGYETLAFQDVIDHKMLPDEDISEVDNSIVFFSVCSVSDKKMGPKGMLQDIYGLNGAQVTSLSTTEWIASLKTSTGEDSTGVKVTALSLPV